MPGKSNSSPVGRAVGAAVALLAVVLLVLDRTTDLPVPYGYDSGSGLLFAVGAVVALALVAVGLLRYRDALATCPGRAPVHFHSDVQTHLKRRP